MLSGETASACETTGTAVFRIVVSSDSMKNATATSHGRICLLAAEGGCAVALMGRNGMITRGVKSGRYTINFAQRNLGRWTAQFLEQEDERLVRPAGRVPKPHLAR